MLVQYKTAILMKAGGSFPLGSELNEEVNSADQVLLHEALAEFFRVSGEKEIRVPLGCILGGIRNGMTADGGGANRAAGGCSLSRLANMRSATI
jgi:hypothetical protein